ncbi:hypothetical protein CCACVL1_11458, partial [Corchorus capsularis]
HRVKSPSVGVVASSNQKQTN